MKVTEILGKNFALKHMNKKINGVSVTIKSYLDVSEYAEVVRTIASSCFEEDGTYRPEYRLISERYVMLQHMTDLEIDMSVEEIFKSSQGGSWFNEIEREVVKLPIWAEIVQAVDAQIEYMILTRQTKFDDLCDTLNTFSEKITDMKSLDEIADKLRNLDDKEIVSAIVEKSDKQS